MTDERADLMLEILNGIQVDVADLRHELAEFGERLSSLEAHLGDSRKILAGRTDMRLDLTNTEH